MKNKNIIYAISTSIIILVIIISIAIPITNNKTENNPIQITNENNGLPKLENFSNFYEIAIKDKEKYSYATNELVKGEIADSASELSEAEKSAENEDYSKTNTQVEGVDESDIVKTDGKYIYYVANRKVVIIDTSETLKVIAQIDYTKDEFVPNELYLAENKLVVIGNNNTYYNKNDILVDMIYPINNQKVITKVYNLENKAKPSLIREVEIEGYYVSSRMIEGNIYVISNKNIDTYLFKDNIEEMDENDYKPKYIDTAISKEQQCLEYSDVYYFPESEDMSYLNIASFNINDNEKANIESYLGAGDEIYCSLNNLYITKVKWEYKDKKVYGYYNSYDINTYIYKFKLENSNVKYENAGNVPGSILNQFSMDEKDGYFRIATTNSKGFSNENNVNNLYVLDKDLQIVGEIENLAKGERIYSVRFIGDKAYMVTFVQTDPLFVIDLSEPTNPTVLGELKIPGYSKYLHPYDETHLIGFGENTKENEFGGIVADGMKMALFDVSDPNKPKELFLENIGESGTYSEILYNHKALLFSKEKNIIAFPIFITEEEGESRTNLKFQGAIIYGLDLESGFAEKGRIAHQETENETFDYDYTKTVQRIIFIKDSLYTLSNGLIKQINIETMEEQNTLELN